MTNEQRNALQDLLENGIKRGFEVQAEVLAEILAQEPMEAMTVEAFISPPAPTKFESQTQRHSRYTNASEGFFQGLAADCAPEAQSKPQLTEYLDNLVHAARQIHPKADNQRLRKVISDLLEVIDSLTGDRGSP